MNTLRLDQDSLKVLSELEEAGMDFWLIVAEQEVVASDTPIVVRGNGVAVPFEGTGDYYTMASFTDGLPIPGEHETLSLANVVTVAAAASVTLPTGYTPTLGAHQLLGTVTLQYPAKFYRYTSTPTDGKFAAGTLLKGTYLTSHWDQQFANTGFGAVGRYALPLPVPASHKHTYTIPVGATLRVGTVAPNYGQAGGGVEVMTTTAVSGVIRDNSQQIDDY